MKALLLAAGKATRLGELSRTTPKCLHKIGDEILLDRLVRQLREVGVTEFLINTHHLADQVTSHVESRADRSDFTFVHEPELMGTLGTLRRNLDFFDSGPGWVLHADNLIPGHLLSLHEAFDSRSTGLWGSMLTFEVDDPSAYGVVTLDTAGVITSFVEKKADASSRTASAATFLFDENVFRLVSLLSPKFRDISKDLLPHLIGRIVAVSATGRVIDIGTPDGLITARGMVEDLDEFPAQRHERTHQI
ncbi:nucleotidyltransferase family protein [Candidatus Nanopelagicales bacterium]|nr:nucleotidyltransferase family protein [Candidatus Nanopelagicales bacterium]